MITNYKDQILLATTNFYKSGKHKLTIILSAFSYSDKNTFVVIAFYYKSKYCSLGIMTNLIGRQFKRFPNL